MQEHKVRQQVYHKLEKIDDLIEDKGYEVREYDSDTDLACAVIDYFTDELNTLIYPAKSYAVAIIYSMLLDEHFGVPFDESINDPDLFMGTDKFFVPMYQNERVYVEAIEYLDKYGYLDPLPTHWPQIATTIDFFKKEFYLNPNPHFNN